jgi:hypothetical protein
VKGCWTREEDETIASFVSTNGDKDWAKLALLLEGRTGKQCRERYKNHLDTAVKHSTWTPEEDKLLMKLHQSFGNAWTKLATFFEGRTDNCIKNRWNSTVKKRLERMENGLPLVMKRGRKPKVVSDSSCASPVEALEAQSQIASAPMMIELMPLNPKLMVKWGASGKQREVVSLEQSRMELQRLLNDAHG